MSDCLICERIEKIKRGENPYFVRELNTGYVVIGDHQCIHGYTLFLCKECTTELHLLPPDFRLEFLREMSLVAEAVHNAFHAEKMNYSLLGVGNAKHMHWHLHPRRAGDTSSPGPVWQLGSELHHPDHLPTPEELEMLKSRLDSELLRLLERV